jgi:hypothetical protein
VSQKCRTTVKEKVNVATINIHQMYMRAPWVSIME